MEVIKINAIWCSGCLVMNKIWKQILEEKNIKTIELDYDMDEEEVKKYNPGDKLPIFIFMDNNKEILRIVGEKSKKEMLEEIRKLEEEYE